MLLLLLLVYAAELPLERPDSARPTALVASNLACCSPLGVR